MDATIEEFPKDHGESGALVKKEGKTHFQPNCIKKLWHFLLHVIFYYITFDGILSRVCLHHFALMNHFRHGIKTSILFYLYSSMNASINMVREKIIINPPLHDGLIFLIYEYIKVHFVGNFPEVKGMEEV